MADVLRQGMRLTNFHALTSVDNYAVIVGKLWLFPCVWTPPHFFTRVSCQALKAAKRLVQLLITFVQRKC